MKHSTEFSSALQKQARREKQSLGLISHKLLGTVNKYLLQDFGKRIYSLKPQDQMRLLTLNIWKEKHKITIREILRIIIPGLQKKARRQRGDSLGIPMVWIVSKHSEEKLIKTLAWMYPDKENETILRLKRQERIFSVKNGEDEFPPKVKQLWECKSLNEFMRRYRSRIKEHRREWQKLIYSPKNQTRAYRNNPFIS